MSALPESFLSEQEYLTGERIATIKHEYINGRVYAQAGASRNHNVLVSNTIIALGNLLKKRSCTVFPSDLRVAIPKKRTYVYPDITVVCGHERFTDLHNDTLLNPTIIIEVLSPSTEAYDRGAKFERYRHIASLQEYILIAQNRIHIEQFVRQADNQWTLTLYNHTDEVLVLSSIQGQVLIRDLYTKIELDMHFDDAFDDSSE